MTLSSTIREQLIRSFGAELAEHVQTMTDGLLDLEQDQIVGEARQFTLENIFRAAHSLKGAARALGVTAVEQLSHALENVLDLMQKEAVPLTAELFTVCYRALDTIQLVQAVYDSGGTTPPVQVLQTLSELESIYNPQARKVPPAVDARSVPEVAAWQPHTSKSQSTPPSKLQAHSLSKPPAQSKPAKPSVLSEPEAEETQPLSPPPEEPRPPEDGTHSASPEPLLVAKRSDSIDETVRVNVKKLDALMAQLSELLITKIRAEQRMSQVDKAQQFMLMWQREWLVMRKIYSRLVRKLNSGKAYGEFQQDVSMMLDYISMSQEQMRQLQVLMNNFSKDYANDTMHTSLVIDALEQEVKQVRMLPLSTITGSFGRMVRDLAQDAQKEALLHIEGGEVELDKRVLEQIKDPLIHLLRNAIDHGLESPEERLALDKPRAGTVTLSAEQFGKEVILRVSDDGRGLDIPAIRKVAARQEHIGEQAKTLSEVELVELIFNPRFSTSPIITDVSGRGMGLDVVRRNVAGLGGRIDVDWIPQKGATFSLILPMTLTSTRGLLVRAATQHFAIPFSAIERILRVKPSEIATLGGHATIHYAERPYPLVQLRDILGLSAVAPVEEESSEHILVVIVATAERRMAFAVDAIEGEQEMVVKDMGKQLRRIGGIAGATVMGSGEVLLVLNVADLIKLATHTSHSLHLTHDSIASNVVETVPDKQILVVDDSVTTRTLEKNVLEAAGYDVQLAVNGQEALSLISNGDLPDLIISDVVMPRLDGFGLTERIKSERRTANIPVILVTSLDSKEDKARGIEVGADAYIVKSHFDQNNLLETIEQLL